MNYKNYNDYELIYKIQENDDDSRDIMYQKYYPLIHNLAYEFYAKYSGYGYDLEDFVQEACILFFSALSTYDDAKDNLFYSYVLMIVKRGLWSFCRNISNTNKTIPIHNCLDIDECFIEDKDKNIDHIYKDQDYQNMMKKVIYDDMTEAGAIMELKWNGFSYREISKLLDIPMTSAEFKCRKARKELRKMLTQYYNK